MLAVIRRFAKTWPARALFGLLVAAFGLWGVAGKLYDTSSDTAIAKVGSGKVEMLEAQRAYARQMTQSQRQNGAEWQPSVAERRQMAAQTVQQLVLQSLLAQAERTLHITAPDAAVREATFALPAFKGTSGQFDRQVFLTALSRNNLDEAGFIQLVREDLGRQQLTGAIGAGAGAPESLVAALFDYQRQSRIATVAAVKLGTGGAVASPTDAELRRFWTNHPDKYAAPEYRRVRVVVLSNQTIARDMTVSDADIAAYYKAAQTQFIKPERRSVEVVSAGDEALAQRMAKAWGQGIDWAAMQAAAKAAGATALELADARQSELPDPALGRAAFAQAAQGVSAPVKGDFGWYLVKVTKVTPGQSTSLAEAHDQIRQKVGELKAADQIDDRVNKLEDALAGGGMDNLPSGLGAAAVEGTLDAAGNTPQGEKAPLPAGPALRAAILAAAFKAHVGQPPQLQELQGSKAEPGSAYYAVSVVAVTPPAKRDFAAVQETVKRDWTLAALRHAAESKAAGLLQAVRSGTPLGRAAAAAGVAAQTMPAVTRPIGEDAVAPPGMPPALLTPLFTLKVNEATMVEAEDGFVVAQLQTVNDPPVSGDPIGAGRLRQELNQSIGSDAVDLYVQGLQRAGKVSVNERLLQQLAQPPAGS